MKLRELFDAKSAFELQWDHQFAAQGEVHAEARDLRGQRIHISFTPVGQGDNATEIVFSRGDRYDMTGGGLASRVMSTVLLAIDQYFTRYHPTYIVFSSKGASRTGVYSAIARRLSHGYRSLTPDQFPWELDEWAKTLGSDTAFVFRRVGAAPAPDSSVAESEGDAEGVPHISKRLLQHIVQQAGKEGARAIVKSLEWGDGAAKELLQLIIKDLKHNIKLAENHSELSELSYTDPGIKKHMQSLGYRSAGEGGDQTTWISPDGSVIKIFGTQEGQQGWTTDHRMFATWVQYCRKHAANPYIPQFSGWRSFEFPQGSGQKYLQIKMERLTPIRDNTLRAVLDQFGWAMDRGTEFEDLKSTVFRKVGLDGAWAVLFAEPTFWNTIKELNSIGHAHGWGLDLHADNYMRRGNQIIIVDPWVASD